MPGSRLALLGQGHMEGAAEAWPQAGGLRSPEWTQGPRESLPGPRGQEGDIRKALGPQLLLSRNQPSSQDAWGQTAPRTSAGREGLTASQGLGPKADPEFRRAQRDGWG